MGNLTRPQWLGLVIVGLSVIGGGANQLTVLFGATATTYILAATTLLTGFIGGAVTILGGQGSQIAAVQAMPGVEKILVNKEASATLATLAVAPDNNKVEATPAAQVAVEATARAAS